MSDHDFHTRLRWTPGTPDFGADTFDRTHELVLGDGTPLRASAAPAFHGAPGLTNPEQLLAAALASCHMITFLTVAARRRLRVVAYEDDAVATLGRLPDGHLAVTEITLHPRVTFAAPVPDAPTQEKLHALAHRNCFIAGAIRATVTIRPTDPSLAPEPPP